MELHTPHAPTGSAPVVEPVPSRPLRSRRRVAGPALGILVNALVISGGCGVEPGGIDGADGGEVGSRDDAVVYGSDDRRDVYQHSNARLVERAEQSTVALMRPSMIDTRNANNVTFNARTLGAAYNLCSTERFRSDPTAAFCSGTLIDDDLVLTAGHCITSATDCTNTRFVFNYYRTDASTLQTVTTSDVFACSEIVARQLGTVGGQNLDYAIVRLNRRATPRFTPAPVRRGATALRQGQNVAVIGSGSGIPFKIDSGGSVRNARASVLDYFVATTDTFGGNSGSGVYETDGYTVAGILVRGETDYRSNGSCQVVNTCSETGCAGESVNYVAPAIAAYCRTGSSSRLCGSAPPPPPSGSGFEYSASNTNNARQNTVTRALALLAGDSVTLGTCGLPGARFTGDTYLRVRGPSGAEVAENDDACGGRGSQLTFTAATSGTYQVLGGCYASGACTGGVVWQVTPAQRRSFAFNASNTNSAQQNTVNHDVVLSAGQTIELGTCNVQGGSGTGDSYLRLYRGGVQVAQNDDGPDCGLLSYVRYTATQSGTYQVRAGCYQNGNCSGNVAYSIQ